MSLVFQEEPFRQAYRDAEPELLRHYDEIAENKDIIGRIDPDLATYDALNEKGRLRVLTARDGGRLVGYYISVIARNLHYNIITATEDMYYLSPEYRRGTAGIRLFVEAEKMVRQAGAIITVAKTKVRHDHGPIFERLGYRPFESVYMKVLRG